MKFKIKNHDIISNVFLSHFPEVNKGGMEPETIHLSVCGNESELIQKAKTGDKAAMAAIYIKYSPIIFATSLRYLNNVEDASDVVQETFIRAFKALSAFQEKAEFSTWLTRICLNLCWHIKKNKEHDCSLDKEIVFRYKFSKPQITDKCLLPNEEIEKRERIFEIIDAIHLLNTKYREILILKVFQGYSYNKIAKTLNISKGTVMSRLYRGKKILFNKLYFVANN